MKRALTEGKDQITLGYKILHLVWESSPRLAAVYFIANVLTSVIPSITLYLGKLNIDAIIAATKAPDQRHILVVLGLAGLMFLTRTVNSLSGAISGHYFNVLKDVFTKYVMGTVLRKAAELDLGFFENAEFHDKLEKVQREIGFRPINVLDQTMEITTSIIGMGSLLFILFHLAVWVPIVIVLFTLPRFYLRLKYSKWTYLITDHRSPDNRRIYQIIRLLTAKEPAKEVKVFGLKDYILGIFDRMNETWIKQNRELSRKQQTFDFLLDVLSIAANIGTVLFAAARTILGGITLGDLTMYSGTIGQFQNVLQGTFNYMARFYESNLFLHHYFEFMALSPIIVSKKRPKFIKANEPLRVEFKNVSFGYDRKKPILKNINLVLADAKNFALVGENGAGKTTLVKLILRLYDVTAGEILINGVDIKEIDIRNLRENIGVIFQDFQTYDMTVRENIGFGDIKNINNIGRIRKAARLSGADEFVEAWPLKYKTVLGRNYEKGEELSGGQWQKIALARAFFKEARVLIMDEPTSALDPRAEYEVFRNLIAHTKDKSLILISHRFSTVRLADEIVVMHKGEIVEQGTHEELIKKAGRYAKLYSLQAKWYR